MNNMQSGQPFDFELQNQQIAQKRAIADALMKQSMTPQQGQMISGRYVAPSPLSYLNQILGMYISKGMQGDADSQQQSAGQTYQKQLAEGLQAYLSKSSGTPAQTTPGQTMTDAQAADLLQNDKAPEALAEPKTTPAVPADPKGAVLDAMTSRLPELRQIGQAGFQSLLKQDAPRYEKVGDSYYRIGAGDQVTPLIQNEKPVVVNNQLVQLGGRNGTPKVLGDYRETFGPVGQVGTGEDDKPIYGQIDTKTGKVVFAPKGVAVNVNTKDTAADAFSKDLAGVKAGAIKTSYEQAVAASKGLDAMSSARQDLEAGIKSGSSANIGLGLAKWGKALGLEGDESIANTEAYRATMARETLQLVKGLGSGSGISNADREFAEKASGGLITLDDKTMLRLMDVATAAAGNTLLSHERLLNRAGEGSGGNEADLQMLRVPINFSTSEGVRYDDASHKLVTVSKAPAASAPKGTAANPMTWEEYQQKMQGGR